MTVPDPPPPPDVIQEPDESRKQPPDNWIPLAKVEVADVEVTLRAVVWTPPANVEVPVPETVKAV